MAKTSGGSKASMPWSVKGVTHEAREVAKDQSTSEGGTMGAWLTGVVRRVGAAEASGKSLVAKNAPPETSSDLATTQTDTTPDQSEVVDEAELIDMVSERIQATEERLTHLLGNIEHIVLRLSDRLERLEDRVEGGGDTPPSPQIASDRHRDIPNID
jgi:localization factor PodJL